MTRKIFGVVFLAKCLYPDKFEDLEPHDFIKEYTGRLARDSISRGYIYIHTHQNEFPALMQDNILFLSNTCSSAA